MADIIVAGNTSGSVTISALYPELTDRDFMTVIILQNDSDGKGDYIAKWEHPTLPRPNFGDKA